MKFTKIVPLLAVATLFLTSCAMTKQLVGGSKNQTVYAFGFSASFTDTLVFLTAVQPLDSVHVEKHMLPGRDEYSYQLKNYLEFNLRQTDRTCAVFFGTDRRSVDKQRAKLITRYRNNNLLKEIAASDFRFEYPGKPQE
jgi:hypothetical protein